MFRSRRSTYMPNIFLVQLQQVQSKVEQAQALLEEANQMAFDLPAFSEMKERVKMAIGNTIGNNIGQVEDTLEMIEKVSKNVNKFN